MHSTGYALLHQSPEITGALRFLSDRSPIWTLCGVWGFERLPWQVGHHG